MRTEEIHGQVTALLVEVIGDDPRWAPLRTARLDEDLRMESVEVLALAARLRERFGERVDLPGYLAGLDIDGIIELTVGDVVDYVARVAG
ncbi:MAG TPA: acyl carrier protein [Pseudonocardiaceae bacterium]